MRRAWLAAGGTACLLASIGCGSGSTERPSAAPLTLAVADTIEGHYVSCETCEVALVAVAEFDVTVGDPLGPGGTLQRVEVVATDASRGTELARNVRPNATVAYPDRGLAAGGRLTVPAGVVISPAPPARDPVTLTISVRLEDGRTATRTVGFAPSARLTAQGLRLTAADGRTHERRDRRRPRRSRASVA